MTPSIPTSAEPDWERFLRDHALGWLLPSACRQAMSPHLAARFLARLTGRPDQLSLLQQTSLIAGQLDALERLALDLLPAWVREMPSVSRRATEIVEGAAPGPLDIPATLALRRRADLTRFAIRRRHRRFDLPESVLVAAVARWLHGALGRLRGAGLIQQRNWGGRALICEGALHNALHLSLLRQVPEAPIEPRHLQAAAAARHPIFGEARWWWDQIAAASGHRPEAVARLVAEGALAPLEPHRRFEYAVCVALIAALSRALEAPTPTPGRWRLERSLVIEGRDEIAAFVRAEDGARIRVYYDTTGLLPPGPRDLGVQRYLGLSGRLRPDITVWIEIPNQRPRAVVIEVKHSVDREYLATGFREALGYVHEYAPLLTGWPRAILVTSAPIPGTPQIGDDAVAVDWARWPTDALIQGMLDSIP